jgi:hypothetical protein
MTAAHPTHSGSCFCGSVHIEVTGEPTAMGYCHCDSCRQWSASPVNAFTLWKPNDVRVTRGAEHISTYSRTTRSDRKSCRRCGGHLFTNHPGWGVVDVYAAMLPSLPFKPALHVNYAQTKLRMKDGLPKMKDMPAEMGGSGTVLAE